MEDDWFDRYMNDLFKVFMVVMPIVVVGLIGLLVWAVVASNSADQKSLEACINRGGNWTVDHSEYVVVNGNGYNQNVYRCSK